VTQRRHFGTTRKLPSGRWQARYFDAAGVRHKAPRTFASKTDTLQWLSTVEADLARGDWHDPKLAATTLGAWVERWRPTTASLRPSTRDLYEYLLRVHILPTFGKRALGQITTVDVQAWLIDRRNAGLSTTSVAKAYRLLARILREAVESGFLTKNPCTIRGAGYERTPEMTFATPEQVAMLADVIQPEYRAFVLTAAYSSLRWGELAGLRRRNVNPLHRTVTVVEQLTEVNGHLAFGPPKTESSRRTVRLPDVVADELAAHLERFAEPGPNGLVFPAAEGGPMRRSNFRRRVWLPALEAAGLSGLRCHDLRHTGSTLAAASGAPLKALMARAGHSTAVAALRYQHVVSGQDEAIARYLNELVEGTQRARNVGEGAARDPETRMDTGGDDGTRTHDPLLAKQVL
jgi:integrase